MASKAPREGAAVKQGRKEPQEKHTKDREWRLNQAHTQENRGSSAKSLWGLQSMWALLRTVGVMIVMTGEEGHQDKRKGPDIL